MKTVSKIVIVICSLCLLVSCNSKPSLQKYYVKNQNNNNFVVLDLPASLFLGDNSGLSKEDQKTISSIKKANILAFPITDKNKEKEAMYEKERNTVENILNDEKYKVLMRLGGSGKKVKIMYLGDPDAIDEVIVYGNDDTKGFAIARVLGNDMNIGAMMKLLRSAKNGNLNVNVDALGNIGNMMETKVKATRDTTTQQKSER